MKNEENNKIDESDSNIEREEEMTRKKVKQMPRQQQKAVMRKLKKGYDPWKTFPKSLKIKVPKSPPTINSKDVDKAIEKIFGKKKKR